MSYCFKTTILAETCKNAHFYWKIAKLAQTWGLRPKTHLPPADGGEPPPNPLLTNPG